MSSKFNNFNGVISRVHRPSSSSSSSSFILFSQPDLTLKLNSKGFCGHHLKRLRHPKSRLYNMRCWYPPTHKERFIWKPIFLTLHPIHISQTTIEWRRASSPGLNSLPTTTTAMAEGLTCIQMITTIRHCVWIIRMFVNKLENYLSVD